MAAIFFMTSFNRDRGGMAPLPPPLDPQLWLAFVFANPEDTMIKCVGSFKANEALVKQWSAIERQLADPETRELKGGGSKTP